MRAAASATTSRWWVTERPFVVALALGVLLRVLVFVAFPPAFVFSDGPTYLGFVDDLMPSPERPIGYSLVLWALSLVTRSLDLVVVVQSVMGLATAVLAYALLRRLGVRPLVATLGVAPLLLDEMQLVLEHSVLSDPVFLLMVMVALTLLVWWRRPPWWAVGVAGLLIGAATVVRLVGQPVLVVALVFVVVTAASWRSRVALGGVLVVAFLLPVGGYAAWYHSEHDRWALSESSGRALYMRTTTFVDCSRLALPAYERPLCPPEPLTARQDPTYYGWHMPASLGLKTPPGITRDQAMKDFGRRAIRAQPLDYARIVGRDVALGFWAPHRDDVFEYDTASKWNFTHYVDYQPTDWTRPAYVAHGDQLPTTRQPVADVLDWYGQSIYVPGPLMLALLLLTVVGLVVRRPRGAGPGRGVILLLLCSGLVMTTEPDAVAQFVWRYQMPMLMLLPMATALAWTRLRTSRGGRSSGAEAGSISPLERGNRRLVAEISPTKQRSTRLSGEIDIPSRSPSP